MLTPACNQNSNVYHNHNSTNAKVDTKKLNDINNSDDNGLTFASTNVRYVRLRSCLVRPACSERHTVTQPNFITTGLHMHSMKCSDVLRW